MVQIKIFQGYTPSTHLAPKLIAPPYDVLNSDEARQQADGNPHSFLHVNKPEIDLPLGIDLYSNEVYEKGRENLDSFVRSGWLERDDTPRLYVYSLTMDGREQKGLVALANVEDYSKGLIKRHELTTKKKEDDRTKLTDVQGANIGPVFCTYKARNDLSEIIESVISRPHYIQVNADDGVGHTLWKCTEEESTQVVAIFGEIPHIYIADGHHRAASAYNVGMQKREKALREGLEVTGEEDFNYFLTILYADSELKIYDYNRVMLSVNGLTEEEILQALAPNFDIYPITDPHPPAKGHFSFYINGKWHGLKVKPEANTSSDLINNLDAQILTNLVLTPVFGIANLRTDDRIDYIGGIRGLGEIERRCAKDAVCGFALYPVQIEELMTIADNQMIMPPKTTWFEPKPRSGMVVRLFEDR